MNVATAVPSKLIKGATGDWEVVDRPGGPCPGRLARPSCFPAPRPNSAASRTAMSRWSMRRCRACCRSSTRNASRRRCAPGSASRRRSICARSSTGRTISIPTCRRAIRSRQYKSPIVGEGEVMVDVTPTEPIRSASSGCTSSRTPASRCTTSRATRAFVDLNRSGVALMEIVSKPDMRSADEAKAYVDQAAHHPALSRHLRRRHGEGHRCAPT